MPNDYGSLDEANVSTTDTSIAISKDKKRSLSQIPEEGSNRFETSIGGSVFSGRGLGIGGAGSLERKEMSKTQLVVLSCIAYGNFWVAACVSLQAPFFPQEAEMKGASSTIYGLIFGVYELMIITMSPVFGKMVARTNPNILVQFGLVVCGLSTIAFGILDRVPDGVPFISAAFVVRILEGIGAASFLTASYTTMAGVFPDRVPATFALLETFFGLGLILGPTVGGVLYTIGGYVMPFVVLGTFLLLGGVIAFCALPVSLDRGKGRPTSLWGFLCDGNTLLDAAATATALNFIGFNAATLEPHLRQFGMTPMLTGIIFVLTGAVYALTSPIMGRLCTVKAIGEKRVCLTGCFLVLIGSLFIGPLPILGFEPNLWVIIVALLVIGLGLSAKLVSSFVDACNHNIKVRKYPDDTATYGMVSALFFSSCSVGAFIGPSAGGFLLDHFGFRWASMYITLMEFLMIVFFFAIRYRQTSHDQRQGLAPQSCSRPSSQATYEVI